MADPPPRPDAAVADQHRVHRVDGRRGSAGAAPAREAGNPRRRRFGRSRAEQLRLPVVGEVHRGVHARLARSRIHRQQEPRRADAVHRGSGRTVITASAERARGFRRREAAVVVVAGAALAVALTWPLAPRLGRIGRDDADARFSIWNVAWVAHALTTDPAHVFDANIFYPHHGTLAYSENNLLAGALAVPVWAATRNPFAAHNFVVLLAFT